MRKSTKAANREQFLFKPQSIIRDKRLTPLEQDYLCLIAGLQKNGGCTASNKYFADFFGVLRTCAVEVIGGLRKKQIIGSTEKKQGGKTIERTLFLTDEHSRKFLLSDSRKHPKRLVGNAVLDSRKHPTPILKKNNIEEKEASPALTFVDLWNSKENLPEIKSFTPQREKQLLARMAEPLFAENWQGIIERLSRSSFCTGNNGRGWKADIDWILKDSTNYAKVLEGKYDNKTDSGGAELPAPDTRAILKGMGWADEKIEEFIADGNSL
jgi:hypothetical protein